MAIYTQAEKEKPMEARQEVTAVAGRGLEGDRYHDGTGSYSDRPGTGRQVTLIEQEAVTGAAAEAGIDLDAGDTRHFFRRLQ